MADQEPLKSSPFWRLAEKLSIVEAALLVIDIEPQGHSDVVEGWADGRKPPHYIAVRNAIVTAIESETVQGKLEPAYSENNMGETSALENSVDYHVSQVDVGSLILWLQERGFATTALDKAEKIENYRDPKHLRYSPKLAAVLEAWEAFETKSNENGTPKQRLMKWLRLNASRFGLTDEEGKPGENVIEELAKVANWATSGGAPKRNLEKSTPDKN